MMMALTPRASRNRLVSDGNSVAILTPSGRSAAGCQGAASGTASTTRTGVAVASESCRSPRGTTRRGVQASTDSDASLARMGTGVSAAARTRLSRVAGERAVAPGRAAGKALPGGARGHRVAHVLEVRGAAPDDHAQAGHRVVV